MDRLIKMESPRLDVDVLVYVPGGEISPEVLAAMQRYVELLKPDIAEVGTPRWRRMLMDQYEEKEEALRVAYFANGKSVRIACQVVGVKESAGRTILIRAGHHHPRPSRRARAMNQKILKLARSM
jgi:hypothetical protein